MTKYKSCMAVAFAALLTFGFAGCSDYGTESTPETPQSGGTSDGESGMESMPGDDETAGLQELSAEDRESAMAQKICPVSEEPLGSMGAPERVNVDGREVWICCDGCRDKLLNEPEKYLANLEDQ
jgi:hypothetical protein